MYFRKRVPFPVKEIDPNGEQTLPIEKQFSNFEEYLDWVFAISERRILLKLKEDHENFVKVFHILLQVKDSGARYLNFIMEYCEGGSLNEAIKEAGQRNFNETTQVFFFSKTFSKFLFLF